MSDRRHASLFEYYGGLHLRRTILWLDAEQPKPLSFISSAKLSSAHRHQKIISTEETAALLRSTPIKRLKTPPQILVTPYLRPFSLGELTLELLPSGVVLGSASLRIAFQDISILYAGPVSLRESPLIERAQVRPCDVLVLPSFPLMSESAFNEIASVEAQLRSFVESAFHRKQVPILFCSPLGDAQQLFRLFSLNGISVRAHSYIYRFCQVFRRFRPEAFDVTYLRRFEGPHDLAKGGEVILWPESLRHRSPHIATLNHGTFAFVSVKAQDPQVRNAMQCDDAFVYGNAPTENALVQYVEACAPHHLILVGTAHHLRQRLVQQGFSVTQLGANHQLELF